MRLTWSHVSVASAADGADRQLATVGLFAGIGGLELGLSRAGHATKLLCEIEPDARAVLSRRFPNLDVWDDVRTLESLPAGTDLLVAGFPCQDLSQAGKTAGIDGERSGLVDHVFRLLKTSAPEWLLLENVPFMLHLGGGRAMTVIADRLEQLGYRWAYRVVDSQAFGLPQRRERVFLVASRQHDPRAVLLADDAGERTESRSLDEVACGFYWTEGNRGLGWAVNAVPPLKGGTTLGSPTPPAILMSNGTIVKPDIRDAERMQGFRANWTDCIATEGARWRLIGNAVSVPVAQWIGRRLRVSGEYDASTDAPVRRGKWPRSAWSVGDGRFQSKVSTWPVRQSPKHLDEFLRFPPKLLSVRATQGFYDRVRASNLRLPPGFLQRVRHHLSVMKTVEGR